MLFIDELTTRISNRYMEKALFSCCAFEDVIHCLIEDLHSSEPSALQVRLRETIHSLTLYTLI